MSRKKLKHEDQGFIDISEDGLEGVLMPKEIPYVRPENRPKPEGGVKYKRLGRKLSEEEIEDREEIPHKSWYSID